MLADGQRVSDRPVVGSYETEQSDRLVAELLAQFAAGRDTNLRADLCARLDWLAANAARRFRDRGEAHDDLLQVARLGLLKALDRFDPDVGTPFAAYAMVTMLGELRRHFRDVTWQVHVPRRVKDLQTSLRTAIESLTHELGRPPLPSELAERLDISEDLVLESLDGASAYRTDSLDTVSAGRTTPSVERLVADEPPMEVGIEIRDVLSRLAPRERRIVELRYFEGWSQSEIADHVGISQVHVSRLLRSTLTQLRSSLAG